MSINKLNFNSSNLSNEINKIINKGLNDLLNDFIVNYKLYEETHNALMNLPSVKHEIKKLKNKNIVESESESDSESEDDSISELSMTNISNKVNNKSTFTSIRDMANEIIKKEMDEFETKILSSIACIENNNLSRYNLFYEAINRMTEKYDSLQQSLQELKQNSCRKFVYDLTEDNTSDVVSDVKIKVEKENIKLEINEIQSNIVESVTEENIVNNEHDNDNVLNREKEKDEDNVNGEGNVDDSEHKVNSNNDDSDDEVESDYEDDEDDENDKVDSDDEDDKVEYDDEDDKVESDDENDSVETEKDKQNDVEEEQDEEYTEIDIDDIAYCTNNEENGFIYQLIDGEVGDKVGYLKDGEPFFYADE